MPKQTGSGRSGKPGNKAGARKPIMIAMKDPHLWIRKHGK